MMEKLRRGEGWRSALLAFGLGMALSILAGELAHAQNSPQLIFGKGDPTHLAITSNQDVFTGLYFPGPGQICTSVAGVAVGCNNSGGGSTSPGGSPGQMEYNNSGTFGGFTLNGDCTMAVPTITCTKTAGTAFGAFATANPASPPAIGGVTPAAGAFSSLEDTAINGVAQNCVYADTSGLLHGSGNACGSGGAAGSFSALTGGTNNSAAMVVTTGASLTATGSGAIGATTLLGQTWATPGPIGGGTPGAGTFSSLTLTGAVGGSNQCIRASGTGVLSGTGTDCNTPSFSGLSSGTNLTAAMLVGSGSSLGFTGTGTLNASQLIGATWAVPSPLGSTTPNTGKFTNITDTAITGVAANCLYADTNGLVHGLGSACGSGGGGGGVNAGLAAQVAVYPANGSTVGGVTVNGGCANLNVNNTNSTLGFVLPVETTITSNYTLTAGDMGCTIPVTGAGVTVNIPSSGFGTSILAPGQAVTIVNENPTTDKFWNFYVVIGNSSSATILPPVGVIGPGESVTLQGQSSGTIIATMNTGWSANNVLVAARGAQLFNTVEEKIYYTDGSTSCSFTNPPTAIATGTGSGLCGGASAINGHCGALIEFTASTAVTVDPSTGLDPGCEVTIVQGGTGKVSLVDSGVTFHNPSNFVGTRAQWSVIRLDSLGSANYVVSGDAG